MLSAVQNLPDSAAALLYTKPNPNRTIQCLFPLLTCSHFICRNSDEEEEEGFYDAQGMQNPL